MYSVKMVTRYPDLAKRKLEWEIQNVSSLIRACGKCWDDEEHDFCDNGSCSSDIFQLPLENGTTEQWQLRLLSWKTPLSLFIYLFGSHPSVIKDALKFHYVVNMTISESDAGESKTFLMFSGDDLSVSMRNPDHKFGPIPIRHLKSIWPNGNLTISVQLFQLSQVEHNVSNPSYADDQALKPDEIELKNSLYSCYGNLLNNPNLSDFKIICKDSTFHAHKFILSVRSRVFCKMIESGLSESAQSVLKIQDMTKETLNLMLEYIYKGTVEHFPEDLKEKIELLDCAEKYELDGLKSICMRKLFSNLNVSIKKNVGELAMAASVYGANDRATKFIKEFCTKNHAQLVKNPEYKKMFLANPQMFMD